MKCVTDSAQMARDMEERKEEMASFDWGEFERKGLDPAVVKEVRAVLQAGIENKNNLMKAVVEETNKLDEAERMIVAACKGPGGFLELAEKEEEAAKAGMEMCLAAVEKLETDAVGLRDVTIAESAPPRTPPPRVPPPALCVLAACAHPAGLTTLIARCHCAVLEREPELRARLEEEIRNHNWA